MTARLLCLVGGCLLMITGVALLASAWHESVSAQEGGGSVFYEALMDP